MLRLTLVPVAFERSPYSLRGSTIGSHRCGVIVSSCDGSAAGRGLAQEGSAGQCVSEVEQVIISYLHAACIRARRATWLTCAVSTVRGEVKTHGLEGPQMCSFSSEEENRLVGRIRSDRIAQRCSRGLSQDGMGKSSECAGGVARVEGWTGSVLR